MSHDPNLGAPGKSTSYGLLPRVVADFFFRLDPYGLDFGDNADEYSYEVNLALPKLVSCGSASEVLEVIYYVVSESVPDMNIGPISAYSDGAAEIWAALQFWRAENANHAQP
jgi:hypothetical protein